MISKSSAPGRRRTINGSSKPCVRSDCASSSIRSLSKCWRGWPFWGTILSSGQLNTLPSYLALAAAGRSAVTGTRAGINASRPRPKPRKGFLGGSLIRCTFDECRRAFDQLTRQAQVALRALAADVIQQGRQAVRRRLAQAYVARDDRFEHAEMLVHFVGDLMRQAVPWIPHREHDAFYRQLRIQRGLHAIDRGHQVRDALECVVFRLQ